MKLYVTLIFTAVGIAFTLGYFALFIQGSNVATQEEVMEINAIKTDFQRRVAPQSIVNFNSLYFSLRIDFSFEIYASKVASSS